MSLDRFRYLYFQLDSCGRRLILQIFKLIPTLKMSEKHLEKGDALPPYSGKLRLFAMRFCPFAERTILVLNAKKLQYDLIHINLDNKPDWIFSFNPKGAVPVLEYEEGKAIFDSSIINAYLDEKYPDPPLQSSDPLQKAHDKLVVEHLSTAHSAYYIAAFNAQGITFETLYTYHHGLEVLQKEIESRGTQFLAGEKPGLVDYTVWPFLERFLSLQHLGKPEFAITEDKYSVLLKYMEAMKNDPAVKVYALAPETHAKYIESRVKGNTDYNMLDTSDVCCFRPRKKKE